MRWRLVPVLALLFCASVARGGWRDDVAPAHLIGQGEFCVFGFCLYNAQLWAQHGPPVFDQPFALVLTYERHIKGARLVETGLDEIKRLSAQPLPAETLTRWRADMARAFGDVAPGDVLCGVYLPDKGARFYTNGRLSATIDDPAFAHAFFDIWLDPATRAKTLRRRLLGEQP